MKKKIVGYDIMYGIDVFLLTELEIIIEIVKLLEKILDFFFYFFENRIFMFLYLKKIKWRI